MTRKFLSVLRIGIAAERNQERYARARRRVNGAILGGEGHAFKEPTIRFHGGMAAGFKAFAVAKDFGLPVYKVRLPYSVDDGFLTGPWWEIVFSTMSQD